MASAGNLKYHGAKIHWHNQKLSEKLNYLKMAEFKYPTTLYLHFSYKITTNQMEWYSQLLIK